MGELHRAVALLRSAQETLGDDADPAVRARLHYTLAQAMVRVEDLAGAHRESSAAMALVPADPPSEVRTWAAATHARMSYSVGRLAEGDAAAEEALAAADALGLDSAWSDTAVSQVRSRQDTDPAAVERRLDEALRRARRSGDVDVEMRVLFNRATLAFEAGRIAESLELDAARHRAGPRPRHGVGVLPRGTAAPAGHRALHGRRLGREPRRGRSAGPGAGDGRARPRRPVCWSWSGAATRRRGSGWRGPAASSRG